ncbi:hypothetical protein QBC46DRAFT_172528 [Diplogelasinospora grovesii]|uniref:Uncharacterized protein n=1 Tax=Diplogelasinospora grovesii TaxID=303347 RepID=A0AAN6NG84_9PEZI|nr:hypothetical protein QBC46DRAFT_172528 [Diplogelasinospora grovesii]
MVNILQALTRPSEAARFNGTYAPEGQNTTIHSDIAIDTWFPWPDFTYENITRIFATELARQYHGPLEPAALDKDLLIFNEEVAEDGLRRFPVPVVNYALSLMPGAPHYGRGTRCLYFRLKADWSLISDMRLDDNNRYVNLVPGDTKLSSKWTPDMLDDEEMFVEWQEVVSQTVTYTAERFGRYGFIVTDSVLVVLRLTRQYTGAGLAANRSPRSAGSGSQGGHSGSDTSMGMSDPSNPSQPSSDSFHAW